jgi:hypothetical protein
MMGGRRSVAAELLAGGAAPGNPCAAEAMTRRRRAAPRGVHESMQNADYVRLRSATHSRRRQAVTASTIGLAVLLWGPGTPSTRR